MRIWLHDFTLTEVLLIFIIPQFLPLFLSFFSPFVHPLAFCSLAPLHAPPDASARLHSVPGQRNISVWKEICMCRAVWQWSCLTATNLFYHVPWLHTTQWCLCAISYYCRLHQITFLPFFPAITIFRFDWILPGRFSLVLALLIASLALSALHFYYQCYICVICFHCCHIYTTSQS